MFETPLTVVGRVITDISQRVVPSGDMVCSFRIVSTERKFNREAQEWVDGDQLFLQVTCWRKLAENVSSSLFKGDNVVVSGRDGGQSRGAQPRDVASHDPPAGPGQHAGRTGSRSQRRGRSQCRRGVTWADRRNRLTDPG
jgi:hypothetical protein